MLLRQGVISVLLVSVLTASPVRAERLKDIGNMMGARSNLLIGYGLVVGLPNTGDDSYAGVSNQSVATMLKHLGVNVDPNNLYLRNIAAVMVTANLPSFVAPGQQLDVTVSSMGNARSLEGGTLVTSPLKGSDLKVYAVAQGPLSVGGFYTQGYSGSRLQKNVTTVGRIPNGAVVERGVPVEMPQDRLLISLHSPDFTTSIRVAKAIEDKVKTLLPVQDANAAAANPNTAAPAAPAQDANAVAANPNSVADANALLLPPEPWASARDSGTIVVRIPPTFVGKVPLLMSELESLDVTPDLPNRVVVNERTGTVVLGNGVRLTPVAIAHGGLTLEVRETPTVSQPGTLAKGRTVVTQQSQVSAQENFMPLQALSPGASLSEIVKALNTLGVAPRDMVAILQALKSAGALRAELEIQ